LQPLQAFVASARDRNPDSLEAVANVDQQQAQSQLAWGRVLPGVTLRGIYTRNQYDSVVSLGPGQSVTVVPLNQRDGFATLTVTLFDAAGFQRIAAAGTASDAADQALIATRLLVEAQTAQAYYQLVANYALLTASQKALEVSQESLRLAVNRNAAGVAPVLDVDRARAEVETQNQQVASSDLQVALAIRALESISGMTPEPGTAPLTDDLHAEPPLPDFEVEVAQLPSVAAAIDNTRSAEQQATATRFALLPTIAGTFTEHGTSASGFVGRDWTWQSALFFNWTLDFTNRANINNADALLAAARAREVRARLAARDNVHRQWETVVASIARSRSAREGQSAATHASQQARDRYQAGAITQLDLLAAQRDAFAADVARIQADADLTNARAQLRLAAGHSLLASGKESR
jgi:outer membrane protein TolC